MSAPGPDEPTRGDSGPQENESRAEPAQLARRVVLIVASAVVAVPFLLGLWLVLSSVLGSGDPHGYTLLGGTFLVLVAGIVLVCVVPWLFAPPLRLRAFGLALLSYLLVAVLVGMTLADV